VNRLSASTGRALEFVVFDLLKNTSLRGGERHRSELNSALVAPFRLSFSAVPRVRLAWPPTPVETSAPPRQPASCAHLHAASAPPPAPQFCSPLLGGIWQQQVFRGEQPDKMLQYVVR
jgi:hypothetical protein